jgi:hypothetical protein
MLAALLLPLLLLPPAPGDLPRSSIAPKDFDKFGKDVATCLAAMEKDDRKAVEDSLAKIRDAADKLAKHAKLDDPLKAIGDWELILERGKSDAKDLKLAVGKGFVRHTFDTGAGKVVCMVSVPPAYGKIDAPCPAIIALKPVLGMSGETLEKEAAAEAAKVYSDLLATTIVIVPLGPEKTVDRKTETKEIEGSWMTADNLPILFTGVKVLLYDLHFDRQRVILDGWKDAGLDAVLVATSFPSWFAGVISRSGDIGGEDVLYMNLCNSPLLYVEGGADARGADLNALKEKCGATTELTTVQDTQSALDPTADARTKITAWITARKRDLAPAKFTNYYGDVSYQCSNWIKADAVSRRATAKPGDKDYPHIDAEIDKASNTIKLHTVNVTSLYVYMNDALVDMSKAVTIEVNGKKRASRVYARDLRFLLDNRVTNNSGDYGLYVAQEYVTGIEPNVPKADAGAGAPK